MTPVTYGDEMPNLTEALRKAKEKREAEKAELEEFRRQAGGKPNG